MHKVINRFIQTLCKSMMLNAAVINVHEIIIGKTADRTI